jgi:hypothetical protein
VWRIPLATRMHSPPCSRHPSRLSSLVAGRPWLPTSKVYIGQLADAI